MNLLREKQMFEIKNEGNKQSRKKLEQDVKFTNGIQKDVRLVEEQQEDEMDRAFNLLPIRKLKEFYWNDVNKDYKYSQHITKDQFMKDFIFLCFFIGNDFLPHFKVINVHKNGVDMMIEKYLEQLKIFNKPLLNLKCEINQAMLLAMLKEINDNEQKYVDQNNRKKNDKIVQYYKHGWQVRYYEYYFNGSFNQRDVDTMCYNFCQVLKWTTNYYFNGTNNWSMYYKYDCAPVFSDLYSFLQNNDINKIQIPTDKPYTANQQLMIILPPHSKCLIPQKYNHLMTGKLQRFYPWRFQLDSVDKYARWQHTPFLPQINDEIIKSLVH